MFTGIIQGLGRMESVENRGNETRFTVRPLFNLTHYAQGESIAINGACMTVETYTDAAFSVYVSGESLSLTNLGSLRTGSIVNIERALAMGDRLGGHMVSGHIDCLAEVDGIEPVGESRKYTLKFPSEHGIYVVPKGSVALDGISLTVNECGPDFLCVNIIPETQKVTTIKQWVPGYKVNMETDIIGKYVQRMVAPWAAPEKQEPKSALTEAFLRQNGF